MQQSLCEARYRLSLALEEQKRLRLEIKELREYISLFQEKPDLKKRDAEIYTRFKNGETVTQLSGNYGLSKETVKCICGREEFREKKR